MISIPLNEFQTLKSEVRHGFAYVNARLDSIDIEFSKVRSEMKAQGDELRAEMKAQGDELRAEMKTQGEELRSEMKAQGEELRIYVDGAVDSIINGMDRLYEKLKQDIYSLKNPA